MNAIGTWGLRAAWHACLLAALAGPAAAQSPPSVEVSLPRAAAPADLAGGLAPGAWPGALRLDGFYEIRPGDCAAPPARTTVYLIRNDAALLVAFHLDDPDPAAIRAPYVERDQVFSDEDFVQLDIDTSGDGRASRIFRVNPRGVQTDGVYTEATRADDFSPDFAFDAVTRRTETGWAAALRIPLSSLPGPARARLAWRLVAFRNYPREFTYQMTSVCIPRGSALWLYHATRLGGERIVSSDHLSVTPYAAVRATRTGDRRGPVPAVTDTATDAGIDLRWTAARAAVVDATVNPDFSQVEADVAQIEVNTRFALRYPEKRPFFMEGVELLATPIAAIDTRSVADPTWGARLTADTARASVIAIFAADAGGGTAIVPGPTASRQVPRDERSHVAIARAAWRLDHGLTPGALFTGRDMDGRAGNAVAGGDVDWQPNGLDQLRGQVLFSTTRTPARADLVQEWDGRVLRDTAWDVEWIHAGRTVSWSVVHRAIGLDFRADTGFVPVAGERRSIVDVRRNWYPPGALSLVQPGLAIEYAADGAGTLLGRSVVPFIGVQGRWGLQARAWFHPREETRFGDRRFTTDFMTYEVGLQPSRRVPRLSIVGRIGQDVDVVEARLGSGGSIAVEASVRAFDRLGIEARGEREWLDLAARSTARRLFTAGVGRLKATYSFSVRAFFRFIVQYEGVGRDLSLFEVPLPADEGSLDESALFGYRLNWRSVLYLGYGDSRARQHDGRLAPAGARVFLKVAYEVGSR